MAFEVFEVFIISWSLFYLIRKLYTAKCNHTLDIFRTQMYIMEFLRLCLTSNISNQPWYTLNKIKYIHSFSLTEIYCYLDKQSRFGFIVNLPNSEQALKWVACPFCSFFPSIWTEKNVGQKFNRTKVFLHSKLCPDPISAGRM